MPITNTSKPVPTQVRWLKKAIEESGGNSASYIVVYRPYLTLVLDRLETLERAFDKMKQAQKKDQPSIEAQPQKEE